MPKKIGEKVWKEHFFPGTSGGKDFPGVYKVPSFGYQVFGTIPNVLAISGSDRKIIVRDFYRKKSDLCIL